MENSREKTLVGLVHSGGNYFTVPKEYDLQGVRIVDVVVDNNRVPHSMVVFNKPREVALSIPVTSETIVEGYIEEI